MALESIALIPSGYKANKLYCQLPVDGGADLTTSRASTATRVNKNGLIESVATGIPRLDYTNGGCPELLLEPQRRNLFPYSEEISSWLNNLGSPTITDNVAISPDGSQNASSLTSSATTGASHIIPTNPSIGTVLSFTMYVKNVDATSNSILIRNTSTDLSFVLNWSGTTLSSITNNTGVTEFEDFGNGWYKLYATYTTVDASQRVRVIMDQSSTTIYLWGVQIEDNGSLGDADYPTSYIKTEGTSVTRIADAATGNSSLGQVINSSEGVLYAEMSALADDLTFRSLSINDGSNSVIVQLRYRTDTNTINFLIKDGVNPNINQSFVLSDITDNSKFAVKYKNGDVSFWANGTELYSGTDTIGLIGLDSLSFDQGTGSENFYGRVKELRVYNTALTDAELTTLTTL